MWTSPELIPLAAFAGPRDEKSAPADRAAPANPKVFRKPRRRFTISWFGSTPSFVSPDSSEEIICAAGGLSLRMINRPFLSMGGFPTSRSHTAAQTLALRKYSSRSHRRCRRRERKRTGAEMVERYEGPWGCSVDPAFIEAAI